jgi:hypothetical protein
MSETKALSMNVRANNRVKPTALAFYGKIAAPSRRGLRGRR